VQARIAQLAAELPCVVEFVKESQFGAGVFAGVADAVPIARPPLLGPESAGAVGNRYDDPAIVLGQRTQPSECGAASGPAFDMRDDPEDRKREVGGAVPVDVAFKVVDVRPKDLDVVGPGLVPASRDFPDSGIGDVESADETRPFGGPKGVTPCAAPEVDYMTG
jgi:hypothetical protein